jgi:rfaE bifunctional protein kinase chain/domain
VIARRRLHEIVDRFAGRRVVVYGDLVLDRFVLGTPKRISREAPVIILRFEEQRDLPGGGANALANIAGLGGVPLAVGVVGDDEPGRALLAALAARGVDCADIVVQPGYRTITKVRLLAGGPSALKFQVARYDVEDRLPDGAAPHADLGVRLARVAATAGAAAISDYGYGTVTQGNVARLRAGLPPDALAVADSRFSLTRLGPVDGVTPNLEELAALAGGLPASDGEVAAAAEALRERLAARFVVATRGSHGLSLVEAGRPPLHQPVFGTDQVADVTGAGDTVLATITLAIAAGAEPAEAATLANLAGGVVVTKLGTATLSAEELRQAIELAPFVGD